MSSSRSASVSELRSPRPIVAVTCSRQPEQHGFFQHVDHLDFAPPIDQLLFKPPQVRRLGHLRQRRQADRASFAPIGDVDPVEVRELPVQRIELELQLAAQAGYELRGVERLAQRRVVLGSAMVEVGGVAPLVRTDDPHLLAAELVTQSLEHADLIRRAFHPALAVKFIGDAVMAHAQSTADAVDAALDFRDVFASEADGAGLPSQLRIGIHLGDIHFAPDGDVYGDGVNVAARLQGEAAAGSIVVSEDVWRQCRQRGDLEFGPLGSRDLKGIEYRMWLYELAPQRLEAPQLVSADVEPPGRSPFFRSTFLEQATMRHFWRPGYTTIF